MGNTIFSFLSLNALVKEAVVIDNAICKGRICFIRVYNINILHEVALYLMCLLQKYQKNSN